ncbi:MAG: endonuclease V [Clostridiaceae bacterium]|jgi:deoxyribonuclease V|nr:endonuclease V [Clostridiaceae bacterium]
MKGRQEYLSKEEEFVKVQYELQERIDFNVNVTTIKTVAGVDLAYWTKDGEEYAVCCIVVLDYLTKEIIEKKYAVDKVSIPYIPGCLAFREIPVFLKAYEMIDTDINVLFFDGNGYLHPRHMGLATHAGILINKATIGVAKSYLKINNVEFVMPDIKQLSYTDIKIGGDVYGRALRTHSAVKPIFLSIGNRMNLELATQLTNELVTKESHIPLPTRLADIMTHEIRKRYYKV